MARIGQGPLQSLPFKSNNDVEGFWTLAQQAIHDAATAGANLILLPELFLGPNFCQSQEACLMGLADEAADHFVNARMQQLVKQYHVILPISFYERRNNVLYNSIIMIDAHRSTMGKPYQKRHIPDGTGYQEEYYFTLGDSGFKVFNTEVGKVGVTICWDQWFPEAARAMALQGATCNSIRQPLEVSLKCTKQKVKVNHLSFFLQSSIPLLIRQ
jgi:N-carbamoylputrescine amidase